MVFVSILPLDHENRIIQGAVASCRYQISSLCLFALLILFGAKILHAGDQAATQNILETLQHENTKGEHVDLFVWYPKYREKCHFLGKEKSKDNANKEIKNAIDILIKEKTLGAPFLKIANNMKTAFCIDEREGNTTAYFDHKYNVIAISSDTKKFEKISIIIHELRHLVQFLKGYCLSTNYDMHEMVRLVFAIEADSQAIATLFAWRMKNNGMPEIWNASIQNIEYSDIYNAFGNEMRESRDELIATKIAFVQWYKLKSRMDKYYRNACMQYLDLTDRDKKIPTYEKLPDEYFKNLCILPDGKNYGCHLTEEIKEPR